MQARFPTLNSATARQLVGPSGALRSSVTEAQVSASAEGWVVGVNLAGQLQLIGRSLDGRPRKWRSLDSCFDFVRLELAINRLVVDASGYVVDTSRKRADVSARMKVLHGSSKKKVSK